MTGQETDMDTVKSPPLLQNSHWNLKMISTYRSGLVKSVVMECMFLAAKFDQHPAVSLIYTSLLD